MGAAENVAKATIRVAGAIIGRKRVFVRPEVLYERTAICTSNAGKCFDAETGRCMVCACIVSLKARLATEKCPRGLWPEVKI